MWDGFALEPAEARGWPREDDLKGLIAYERHLAGALRDASAELERAVAGRRLGEMARQVRGACAG